MRKFILILVLLTPLSIFAQELNCDVVVVADQIVGANQQIFKTLEKSVYEFMNQTKWTDKTYEQYEKISCSILLTLVEKTGEDSYKGTIQVQSSRPVYNSIYTTPILNYKDSNLAFSYVEFSPLQYDDNTYQSDLISTLSYFAYLIIGFDADTFKLNGGTPYYSKANHIIDLVKEASEKAAWKTMVNKLNRYSLINGLLSPSSENYRMALYTYHLKGLDVMESDVKQGQISIFKSISLLRNTSSKLNRVFIDAKSEEILSIFKDNAKISTKDLVVVLNKIAPYLGNSWQKIK